MLAALVMAAALALAAGDGLEDLPKEIKATTEFPAHNPKPLLARRIKEFLEATEGIDFDAPLVSNGELKLFKNPDYEARPKAWKMGYRAGKQATEKARELARDWLKTLE
jgi:hypothetical protein